MTDFRIIAWRTTSPRLACMHDHHFLTLTFSPSIRYISEFQFTPPTTNTEKNLTYTPPTTNTENE